MEKEEKEINKKWRDRDWIWTIGVLIAIIIFIIANKASKNLENNFSIISSAVSIALALIAIFYSSKQDGENKRSSENIGNLVRDAVKGITKVDTSMIQMQKDIQTVVNAAVKLKIEETAEEIENGEKENYTKKEMEEILEKLKEPLYATSEALSSNYDIIKTRVKNLIERNPNLTFNEIFSDLEDRNYVNASNIQDIGMVRILIGRSRNEIKAGGDIN